MVVTDGLSAIYSRINDYLKDNFESVVSGTIQEVGIKRKTGSLLSSIKYLGQTKPGYFSGEVSADYASYLNEGYDSFDMKCLVDGKTKILTSDGWKQIKEIKENDLVLTHTGKFKRVIKAFCEENKDEFVYQLYFNKKKISFTANHPILTNDGWKRIDKISNNDKIIGLAKKCDHSKCNNLTYYNNKYCSKSCAAKINNKFRRFNGRPDLSKDAIRNISKAMTETNERMYKEGKHVSQGKLQKIIKERQESGEGWGYGSLSNEELSLYQKKAAISLGKKARTGTYPEVKFIEYLNKLNQKTVFYSDYNEKIHGKDIWIRQYPLLRINRFRKNGIQKRYFLDFYNPYHKIDIEVNGERYHTQEQDIEKCKEIEKEHGTQYLSFWSKEIFKKEKEVIEKVERVLKNHNGEYLFFKTSKFKIKKIKKTKFGFFKKWNLEVDIDNSFIVSGGLVVHNSGLMGKTIPLQTPEGLIFRKVGPNSKGWIHPGFEATNFVEKAQEKLYKGILKVVDNLSELSPEVE